MGLLGWNKEPNPLIPVIEALSTTLERQRADHQDQINQLIEQMGDQNRLLKELLDQYINRGINTNESLNDRIERKDQYLKEPEWEPFGADPFEGM